MVSRPTITELEVERQLENYVKRLDPLLIAFGAGYRTLRVDRGEVKIQHALPHVLARITEATCAYHRKHYKEDLAEPLYNRIHNLLSQHTTDFDRHALKEHRDIDLFMQRTYREQIELQYNADLLELARLESLLRSSSRTQRINESFQKVTGIGLDFYVAYSLLIYHNMVDDATPGFRIDRGTEHHGGSIRSEDVEKYLRIMSYTTRELGEEYIRRRQAIDKTYLRSLAKWVLVDRPLIQTPEGMVVAPFPDLIVCSAMRRSFEVLLADADGRRFLDEAFEEHVGRWAKQLAEHVGGSVSQPDKVSGGGRAKRCDYKMEWSRGTLLIECKATGELPTFFTKKAMKDSTVSAVLTDAFGQLESTSDTSLTKPVYGIVVTPFEMPFPNSKWFISRTVGAVRELDTLRDKFALIPQVMASRDIEYFVSVCIALNKDPSELFTQKTESDYFSTCEWRAYLDHIRKDEKIRHPRMVHDLAAALSDRARALVG